MNINNMKRLKRFLEALPEESFAYDEWINQPEVGFEDYFKTSVMGDMLEDLYVGKCGTTGCIAGAAAAIMAAEEGIKFLDVADIADKSREWLDLKYDDSVALFHGKAMVDIGLYEDNEDAMCNATHMDAAKVLGVWIDEAEAQ